MNNLFTENGFLSDIGKETFSQILDKEINILLNDAKSENEARLITSLIYQRIGNITADYIAKLMVPKSLMSKEEYSQFLVDKYGINWCFSMLSGDEYDMWYKINPFT
jgi:hypothetical protein